MLSHANSKIVCIAILYFYQISFLRACHQFGLFLKVKAYLDLKLGSQDLAFPREGCLSIKMLRLCSSIMPWQKPKKGNALNVYYRLAFSLICINPIVFVSSAAAQEMLDAELGIGQTQVNSRRPEELDKNGMALSVMARAQHKFSIGSLGIGIGALSSKVEGKRAGQSVKQSLSLNLLLLETRYAYEILDGLELGPSLRLSLGKGAKYGVLDNQDVDTLLSPGAFVQYSWKAVAYEPKLSLAYYQDINVAERQIHSFLIGLSVATQLPISTGSLVAKAHENKPAELAAPSPMVEAPQIVEIKAPAQDPASGLTPPIPEDPGKVETLIFRFAPNSTRLNGISREKAKAVAKVLVEHPEAWSKILVTGHTDKSGVEALNKQLSQKRSDAFCDMMAKRGVPRKKMRCEARGSDSLLPELAENAEEHRRIELEFEGLSAQDAKILNDEIEKALKR